jgi:hypothetical protein
LAQGGAHPARRSQMGRQTRQGGWEAQHNRRASGAGCRITKAVDANTAPRGARGINTTRMRSNLTSPKRYSLFACGNCRVVVTSIVHARSTDRRLPDTPQVGKIMSQEDRLASYRPCAASVRVDDDLCAARLHRAAPQRYIRYSSLGCGRPAALHG